MPPGTALYDVPIKNASRRLKITKRLKARTLVGVSRARLPWRVIPPSVRQFVAIGTGLNRTLVVSGFADASPRVGGQYTTPKLIRYLLRSGRGRLQSVLILMHFVLLPVTTTAMTLMAGPWQMNAYEFCHPQRSGQILWRHNDVPRHRSCRRTGRGLHAGRSFGLRQDHALARRGQSGRTGSRSDPHLQPTGSRPPPHKRGIATSFRGTVVRHSLEVQGVTLITDAPSRQSQTAHGSLAPGRGRGAVAKF